MRQRKFVPVAAGLALLLAVAACSNDSNTGDGAAPAPQASGEALNLKGTCPDTVVIQTDWFPESEYGFLYQLLGPGYTIDKGKKRVSGPLVASGQDTGVKVEIRTGGPAIGFQQVSAQMYADKSITLGQVSTDEAIQNSAKQPTLAVVGSVVGDFFFKQGDAGIGVLIDLYRARLQSEQLFGAALAASLLGVVAFWVFGLLNRVVTGGWYGAAAYDKPA